MSDEPIKSVVLKQSEIDAILTDPPEGLEMVCDHYRATLANLQQAQNHRGKLQMEIGQLTGRIQGLQGASAALRDAIVMTHLERQESGKVVEPPPKPNGEDGELTWPIDLSPEEGRIE